MNSQEVLQQIAKQNRLKVSRFNLYDRNVCSFESDPNNIARIIATEGQPFLKKISYVKDQWRVRLEANDNFMAIDIAFQSELGLISINRTNENNFLKPEGQFVLGIRRYPMFVRNSPRNKRVFLLENPNFRRLIERIDLTSEESVHLSSGNIRIYLWRPSAERTLGIIDYALAFVKTLVFQPTKIDFAELPERFKSLVPLIQSWGKTDDSERDELREAVSPEELQALVAQVKPYFPEINEYLHSFGDRPMPEAATRLGALAEFAAETELLLKRPR